MNCWNCEGTDNDPCTSPQCHAMNAPQCSACGHDDDRHGPEAGGCIECRCTVTAAKPRHLAAVGLMKRCIVHDQSYTRVCPGCRADGLAYDKEVS